MAYLIGAVGWANMANLPIEKLGGLSTQNSLRVNLKNLSLQQV